MIAEVPYSVKYLYKILLIFFIKSRHIKNKIEEEF